MPEFDEAYVKKLREEAAQWRTKCRELETQSNLGKVETELAKRGIEASPQWVHLEEGQSLEDAVTSMVDRYPHLKKAEVEPPDFFDFEQEQKTTPKAVPPSSPSSTTPKPARATRISKRNIEEIRKDPKARAKVRSLYRELLANNSNQGE